jgi:hypothetical protein
MKQEFLLVNLTVDGEHDPSKWWKTLSRALSATSRGQQSSLTLLYYFTLRYVILLSFVILYHYVILC